MKSEIYYILIQQKNKIFFTKFSFGLNGRRMILPSTLPGKQKTILIDKMSAARSVPMANWNPTL